ncbi:hypothetical protein [Methanosarcina siciliae]|nr:hypothetical protein [Methanosarcina siciliae]
MTIILIIIPVNAGEISVTFEEGRLCAGEEIGNTYSDQGITFSHGVQFVDLGNLNSEKEMGFWNPDNRITQIYFSPAVTSVSIDFENTLAGNLDAFLVNGKVLSKSEYNCEWTSKNTLRIESNDTNIQSIEISSKLPCSKKIKFDNLCYEQVTETLTNSSRRNNRNSGNADNEDPDDENKKISSGKSKNSDNTDNKDCKEEAEETIPGNDTNSDNSDNEDCGGEIEETPCKNDTEKDEICPGVPEKDPCNDTEKDEICPGVPEKDPCNDTEKDEICPGVPEKDPCNDTEKDEICPGVPEKDPCNDTEKDEICPGVPEKDPCNDTEKDEICPDVPEKDPCNDTEKDEICPDVPEKDPCNDTEKDEICPDVPEKDPCKNDTKPDKPCNQEIPEYPSIVFPVVTILGMIFILQRGRN